MFSCDLCLEFDDEDKPDSTKIGKKEDDDNEDGGGVDFDTMAQEIEQSFVGGNSKVSRMLNISKEYNKRKESSDNDDNFDESSEESSDSNTFEQDKLSLKSIYWGSRREDYYGADTQKSKLANSSENWQRQELRDEELIGIQLQNEQLENAKLNVCFYCLLECLFSIHC